MWTRTLVAVGLAFLLLGLGNRVAGQETDSPTPAEAPGDDVSAWIRQLDADRFPDREAASEKLTKAGAQAIPALIEAGESGSPETAARVVNILADHLAKEDPALRAAAKAGLEKLAAGENAVAARRAKAALEESNAPQPAAPNPAAVPLRIFGNAFAPIGGGQIQIRVQQIGPQVRRVTVANNNGVKQIDAEENGRKVKIKDDPQNGIEMEVTETQNGKAVTKKYQAKDADDLKKKHPDAYKLFEQYANQAQPAPRAPNVARRVAEAQIQSLQRHVEAIERTLGRLENEADKETLDEVRRHLKNVQKELEQAKEKLASEEQ